MADSDLLITISGAALSLLFYENVRCCGDQMGFLLGETLEFVVKTYTDADNQIETVKIHNNIETVVSCPLPELLHNSVGRLNKEKLKAFIRDQSKQVIGWFRFRRDTGLVPTIRDKMLHKEFVSHFSDGNGSKPEFFVTCLLSSSMSSERGTHKFKHVFLRQRRGTFEPVPVRINNLGIDPAMKDDSDYKPTPIRNSSDMPDAFTRLIESLSLDITRTSGLESAITIQKAAEQYLNELIPELCNTDHEVAELEKQVREFKLSRKARMNGSSNNVDKKNEVEKDHPGKEGSKSERISPPRIESPDHVYNDKRTSKDYSSTASQSLPSPKSKNTALYIEKSTNQNKSRKPNADAANNTVHESPPPANAASETKVDVGETVSNRGRRFSNMESEIVKESICKGETNESGVGRGRGKLLPESHPGMKKSRRTSGPMATRNSNEKPTLAQVSRQDFSEANNVQNTPPQVSYSQIAKKKINNTRKSDSTDNY